MEIDESIVKNFIMSIVAGFVAAQIILYSQGDYDIIEISVVFLILLLLSMLFLVWLGRKK